MDRRRDRFVDNFIVDTTFETHSKSCYTVPTIVMSGKCVYMAVAKSGNRVK